MSGASTTIQPPTSVPIAMVGATGALSMEPTNVTSATILQDNSTPTITASMVASIVLSLIIHLEAITNKLNQMGLRYALSATLSVKSAREGQKLNAKSVNWDTSCLIQLAPMSVLQASFLILLAMSAKTAIVTAQNATGKTTTTAQNALILLKSSKTEDALITVGMVITPMTTSCARLATVGALLVQEKEPLTFALFVIQVTLKSTKVLHAKKTAMKEPTQMYLVMNAFSAIIRVPLATGLTQITVLFVKRVIMRETVFV